MHMIAEHSREKFNLQWIQCIILLYSLSYSSAIIDVSLLYTTVATVPMLPDVEKTKGENDPYSISLTRSPYALFFSSSFYQ